MVFLFSDYFESLPEDDEVRKYVNHAVETLQSDTDRDVRYFPGGIMNARTSSLRFLDEVDYDRLHGGVRMIE